VTLDCLTAEDLLSRIEKSANVILVDTIGNYDGNRFRIKGATTIPYPEVVDRRKEFNEYNEIIIYCANRNCSASKKVASALKMLNVPNVRIYEGGIKEWLSLGLAVEEI
jgi:rhodanese-related sulfurtransferase